MSAETKAAKKEKARKEIREKTPKLVYSWGDFRDGVNVLALVYQTKEYTDRVYKKSKCLVLQSSQILQ